MKTLTIRQLIDFVEGDASSVESCIQKIFEWRFERDMTVAKWALGVSASLAVALSIAYFRSDQEVGVAEFGTGLFFAAASATYGIYVLIRLRQISSQFTAAVALYAKLKRIDEFIWRYRGRGE